MNIKNNLIGKKFNRLKVIEVVPRNLYVRTKYRCKCECGVEVIVDGSKLQNNHTKSCGCIRKEVDYGKHRKSEGEASKNGLIWSYKSNAKRKNKIFNLTEEQMINLFKSNCFYCGSEPKNIYYRKGCNGHYIYNGIDRKNNDIGYVIGNVVPCCSQCNYVKNSFNFDDFIVWINKVYKNLQNK